MYTKGTWEARHTSGAGWAIWADLRQNLGEKYSKDFPIAGNDALQAPKVMIAYETWVQFPSEEFDKMQAANMALIAAAPELLEALQEMVQWQMDSMSGKETKGYPGTQAMLAINKALGKV